MRHRPLKLLKGFKIFSRVCTKDYEKDKNNNEKTYFLNLFRNLFRSVQKFVLIRNHSKYVHLILNEIYKLVNYKTKIFLTQRRLD